MERLSNTYMGDTAYLEYQDPSPMEIEYYPCTSHNYSYSRPKSRPPKRRSNVPKVIASFILTFLFGAGCMAYETGYIPQNPLDNTPRASQTIGESAESIESNAPSTDPATGITTVNSGSVVDRPSDLFIDAGDVYSQVDLIDMYPLTGELFMGRSSTSCTGFTYRDSICTDPYYVAGATYQLIEYPEYHTLTFDLAIDEDSRDTIQSTRLVFEVSKDNKTYKHLYSTEVLTGGSSAIKKSITIPEGTNYLRITTEPDEYVAGCIYLCTNGFVLEKDSVHEQ